MKKATKVQNLRVKLGGTGNGYFPCTGISGKAVQKHLKGILSISVSDLMELLAVDSHEAETIAREWRENEGGKIVDHAGIYAYYFA